VCVAPGGIVFVMPGGYGAVLAERALDDVSPGELIGIRRGPTPGHGSPRVRGVHRVVQQHPGCRSPTGFENGHYDTIKSVAVTGYQSGKAGQPLRGRQISSGRPRWPLDAFSSLVLAAC
jgi:hypothetical protein